METDSTLGGREPILKKTALSFLLILAAILIDGTLTRDIFDYGIHTAEGWVSLLLILAVAATVAWADSTKKSEKENNPE